MKRYLYFIIATSLLSSCALFKKDRVLKNKELEKIEYGFNTFFYPSKTNKSEILTVFLSGDGGWVDFDDNLCKQLAVNGSETLGINSRSYFWKERTPKSTGAQMRALIRSYVRKTDVTQIYLVGYSFGADVTPFIYNELPFFMKRRVKKLVLLSPFATTDFQVHLSDLLGHVNDNYKYSVREEIAKIKIPIFCFYGRDEEKALATVKQENFKMQTLKGDHRYDEQETPKIVQTVMARKN